jgi:1-acyl-sn-glycerol-3-phosphate acyltransferase
MKTLDSAAGYRESIIAEICYALGVSRCGLAHRMLALLLSRPIGRLAAIAARADAEIDSSGLSGAARRILPDLSLRPLARGAEGIPAVGPLLMVSNHPGGFDSVAILSCIPRRDIKVVLSDAPLTRAFSAARRYFIFAALNAAGGAKALRDCIDHLKNGGAVFIFANGDVEPDPEISGEADLPFRDWSRSVEIMLREVPEAWLQVAIISGVLMPKYRRHPLVRIRKTAVRRQKLAEVLQILRQLISPRAIRLNPRLSFAEPIKARDLDENSMMPSVIGMARRLLEDHLVWIDSTASPTKSSVGRPGP